MSFRLLRGASGFVLAAFLTCLLTLSLTACRKTAVEWAEQGEQALKRYDLNEAERNFQQALELDPRLPRALYGLGWVYNSRRDMPGARVFFERCIEVAPDYYGGYKGMGSVHLAMGFYPQAEASLQRAVALKADEAASHGSLGYVYLVTRRLDLAETHFRRALELEPTRGELHYFLAELRARQGLYDEALKELELGQGKPIEEVKFRMLNAQLRGRLLLHKASRGLAEGDLELTQADKQARLELLRQADQALDEALAAAFEEEMVRIHQLKRKVKRARDRLEPPPI